MVINSLNKVRIGFKSKVQLLKFDQFAKGITLALLTFLFVTFNFCTGSRWEVLQISIVSDCHHKYGQHYVRQVGISKMF